MTPIKDKYAERVENLDSKYEYRDMKNLTIGDYIGAYNNCQTRGFVKKVSKVNVLIETTYGGYADNDCELMELKIPISEIRAYYKPLTN